MITLFYCIASALIVLGLFIIRSRRASDILGVLFLGVQTLFCIHSFSAYKLSELGYFTFDSLGILLLLILTVVSYPALVHSRIYLKRSKAQPSSCAVYCGSIVLLIVAMSLGYLANHIVVTWIFTEITTLSAAMLVYHHRSRLALEATWKYVFVCAVSICFVFVGILFISLALLHAGSADLSYASLTAHKDALSPLWLKLGFVFIFAGYTAKLGLFPMFTAGIDAKDKAPSPAAALLASVLMNLGLVGVYRCYGVLCSTSVGPWARMIMLVSALVTLFIATAYMVRVRNLKRMLAYSGIEHMSVVILGICFGPVGCIAALLHCTMHSLIKPGLFFHVGQIWKTYGSRDLDEMGGYLSLNPFGALVLLLGFVSITAVPPSGLFISELLVFKSMIAEGAWLVLSLVAFMLTVLIWAFARSIFKIVFLPLARSRTLEKPRISAWESVSQLVLFILAAYIGFAQPSFLLDLIYDIASMIG